MSIIKRTARLRRDRAKRPEHPPAVAALRTLLLIALVAIGGLLGYYLGQVYSDQPFMADFQDGLLPALSVLGFTVIGMLLGVLAFSVSFSQLVAFTENLKQMPVDDKLALFLGALLGLVLSGLLMPVVAGLRTTLGPAPTSIVAVMAGIILLYVCTQGALSMKSELHRLLPHYKSAEAEEELPAPKILDTNIIIDGRISEICRTGFLSGTVYIPGFVLDELQQIADSSDQLKRARGRRGLELLNQMRKELPLVVRVYDEKAGRQHDESVDARLVRLASALDGQIVTNDYNLNKVAELQGVTVLNVNELAAALKPVVMPGEELQVRLVKEGREPHQAIAYLDDGTMVVVENARRQIGETVNIIVSSVIQTVAGKMVFGALRAAAEAEQDTMDRNVRSYTARDAPRARRGRSQTSS